MHVADDVEGPMLTDDGQLFKPWKNFFTQAKPLS
jgi:hypothetical protein